jgi:hypothetical protein
MQIKNNIIVNITSLSVIEYILEKHNNKLIF